MDYPGFPYVGILLMCLYCTALGVILTFITIKTNSVWPAAFMHGVNNSMPSMLVLFMKDADHPLYVYALSLTPIVLIGVVLFIVLIRGKK